MENMRLRTGVRDAVLLKHRFDILHKAAASTEPWQECPSGNEHLQL
jgi:hypothetical protein